MSVRIARRAVGVLLCAHAALADAEVPGSQLEEVVVTATRTRTRAADVTTSVTVIGGDQIEQRDQATVTDALRGSPGLDITEFGSPGHSAFVSIRGAAPDQVLVLLDGVEVNAPSVGLFDFANLSTGGIDRIEILRGGGGTLYGSEAIGGVINVITRRGEGPLALSAMGEAGSAATHRETLSASGARGPLGVSGTASFLASNGFRSVNDDYRNFSTAWRADADLLAGGTLRGILRYTNSRAGLVNFKVAEGVLDPDARDRSDFFLAKGEWEHSVTGMLTYRAAAAVVRNNERFGDERVDPAEPEETQPAVIAHFPTQIIQADTQVDHLWREVALTTVGLEFKERSARVYKWEFEDEEDEAEVERFSANRSNVGLFAQEQVRFFGDTLRGVGGLRYDHFDQFGDQVTFSGSGSYLVGATGTRLRLGYAEGFRAPTFDELFEPGLGNPDLEAEESWEINAGFTQELFDVRLRMEPTYFYRQVTNSIEEIVDQLPGPVNGVPEGEGTFNANARFQGAELGVRAEPARWLTLWANYTYLNAGDATGTLLNRPRHRGSLAASAERHDLLAPGDHATATVQVYAVGRRASADPASRPEPFAPAEIGGYGRTDLALAYECAGRWAPLVVTATVRNLFNRDYSESIGFPAAPARFLIGLGYRL